MSDKVSPAGPGNGVAGAAGNTDVLGARPMSVQSILNGSTKRLTAAGIENARQDAEFLLADFLACDHLKLFTQGAKILNPDDVMKVAGRVERRAARCPLQYILGHAEFLDLSFRVSPHVLIPRPETEQLVQEALKPFEGLPPDRRLTVVDLGTGSGVIAVSLAKRTQQARLFATDLSPEALALARENAATHGVEERITFLAGDLFEPLRPFGLECAVDLVCSNPPYIAEADHPTLPPEVRDYEPRGALLGGPDGLAVVRRILVGAQAFLRPHGHLLVEIGFGQAAAVREFLESLDDYDNIQLLKDYQGIERLVLASYYPWSARLQSSNQEA
ncbi:MAG: peptide chain release factor N(5)-glutamine methyltransferase [Planctomycetes bacterium]|nr:peptide chain release factor N(5)-glutamine methyltransferase [Planctomycetota bacterium]